MPRRARTLSIEAVAWGGAAMLLALAALLLAFNHPLWPAAVAMGALGWGVVAYRYPNAWLFALPAGLPALNWSPWTGWIGIEEFDIFVLAAVAAGYARLAWHADERPLAMSRTAWVGVFALAFITALGLWRGIADAGGWRFGWFQGYTEPLNSLRVAKSLIHALLLLPLLRREWLADADAAFRRFAFGMVAGAAVLTAAVFWERAAFPGLLDLVSPYRTVGLFWEMHVGGAAIDAYVVLCTPFVAWALWAARTRGQWLAAALFSLLWGYACLTTFSRGAYLGAAVSLLVLGLLLPQARARQWWPAARAVAFVLGSAVLLALVLDGWGYGAAALALLALSAAFWLRWRAGALRRQRQLAAGLLGLALIFEAVVMLGPDSFMSSRVVKSAVDYESRTAHWARGIALLHSPADWLFGLGLGRLPANYDRFVSRGEFSGSVDWRNNAEEGGHVQIAGPRTRAELGGHHALTQRVPLRPSYQFALDLQVDKTADLYVRVCESHLLYDGVCQSAVRRVVTTDAVLAESTAKPGWQRHEIALSGAALHSGVWFAPRQAVLSISVLSAGRFVDVDNVTLGSAADEDLLENGNFSAGMAHWLPSAQSYFLPWHIDNLFVETLVERGLLGLLVLSVMAGAALVPMWRRADGAGAASPFVCAAFSGLLCVGLVSSVFDVPRVALLSTVLAAMCSLQHRGRATGPASCATGPPPSSR